MRWGATITRSSRASSSSSPAGCRGRRRRQVKVFVDTAPLMEKPLAAKAGIGWQGKHTNLVSRATWLLDLSRRHADDAGARARCAAMRTTAAAAAPASTSAPPRHSPRPISSIRGAASPISPSSTRAILPANSATPWATASMAATTAWRCARGTSSPRSPREAKIRARADLDRAGARGAGGARRCRAFAHLFAGSPVKRTGRDRFVRNVLIAIGNSSDAAARRRPPRGCRRPLAAGPGDGRLGAVAAVLARALSGAAPGRSWPARPTRRCAPNGGAAVEAPLLRARLCRDRAWRRCWRRAGFAIAGTHRSAEAMAAPDHAGYRPLSFDGTRPIPPRHLTGSAICSFRSRPTTRAIRSSGIIATSSRRGHGSSTGSAICRRPASMAIGRAVGSTRPPRSSR